MAVHAVLTDDLRDQAALFALDLLEGPERDLFEQHLRHGCQVCKEEVRAMSDTAAQLAFVCAEAPSRGLRERVLSATKPLPEGMFAVRADEGSWRPAGPPGISFKPLYRHPETGQITQLVRLSPGSRIPRHFHTGDEQCLVLEGDVEIGGALYHPGDFSWAVKDTTHDPVTSPTGCLLLIVSSPHDEVAH